MRLPLSVPADPYRPAVDHFGRHAAYKPIYPSSLASTALDMPASQGE